MSTPAQVQEVFNWSGHVVLDWEKIAFFTRGFCINCGCQIYMYIGTNLGSDCIFMELSGEINRRSLRVHPFKNPLNGVRPFLRCHEAVIAQVIQ